MTVSDITIQAKGLSSFFKDLGRVSVAAFKKQATNVLRKPGRAHEITSNIATAAAAGSPETALSTLPEVTNFYDTGESLYLGIIV